MNRIEELEKLIEKHKELYYTGKPEVSDEAYDQLEDELRKLDPTNEILKFVGHKVDQKNKVKHERKMLSLAKTYDIDELWKWSKGKEIVSTYKIDGVSCSIVYQRGSLVIAKTRGDGVYGENISEKVQFIEEIPKRTNNLESSEIRGELYCTSINFKKLLDEMAKRDLAAPSNQRNIVAGLIGRKENVDLCKYLSFMAFDILSSTNLQYEVDKAKILKSEKFKAPEMVVHKSKDSIKKVVEKAKRFMLDGEYQIDGLVFTINDLSEHTKLGQTAHHPRYKMAFKFQGEVKKTRIIKINWQVSRNGVITPIANIDPIEISGAKVSRVTLHNYGVIKQYNLKKNDIIEVIRSGEVIPKLTNVISSAKGQYQAPTKCPSCNEGIKIEDIRLRCVNTRCPAKQMEEMLYYIKKIGIEDISSKRLNEIIESGMINDISDLYRLSVEDLMSLDKVKDKLANKLYRSIQNSKEVDLIKFLSALGVKGAAQNKCEKIIENGYDTLDKILKMSVNELQEIESFAEKSAREFIFSLNEKRVLIKNLIDAGVNVKRYKRPSKSKVFQYQVFCITGKLNKKRTEVEKIIKDAGGDVVGTVSKNTTYLVMNDTISSSSKYKKAIELGVKIIKEQEVYKKIEENGKK